MTNGQAPSPNHIANAMSEAITRMECHYLFKIWGMCKDMIQQCRTCPLAPCGHKRNLRECRERIERHYGVYVDMNPIPEPKDIK